MHEDPYPTYARLREEAPAYHNPELGFWGLSRFVDVLNGYRDWETFTSTRGIALGDAGSATTPSMIGMDPPDQTKLRKLAVHAFSREARDQIALALFDEGIEKARRQGSDPWLEGSHPLRAEGAHGELAQLRDPLDELCN